METENAIFKKCNVCHIEWRNLEDYLLGTTEVCKISELGLALRNCKCGTTIGMTSEETYPNETNYFTNLWDTDPKYWFVKYLRKKAAKERK